ncbi:g8545 [Coccomyxa elongata]
MKLSDNATLSEVKAKMTELYDDHPHPATITVIFAGKVLKDDSVQLNDVFKAVAKADILPAMHVVVRPDGMTMPGDMQRQAEQPRQLPVNATAPLAAAQQPAAPRLPPTPQPPPPSTALHGSGHQVAHQGAYGGAAAVATASISGVADLAGSGRPAGAAATAPSSVLLRAAAERQAAAAAARTAPSQSASPGAAASSSRGGTSPAVNAAAHKGKAPASSDAAPAQPPPPPPPPRSPGVSPTVPTEQRASSSGLPQPELPPQLVNNPAMAAAFSAAFAALTSPTAIHNLGVPQMGPVQPHHPVQGHASPQQALLDALVSGQHMQQQHPFPHLQPIFPQPISYMPVLGLVQPPPAENGQQQQPHYAPVLAPVVPMMMPYGMMPYSTGHVHYAGQQQPMPPGAQPQQPQQQPRLMQNFLQGVPGIGVAWGQGGAAAAAARGGRPGRERRPRPVRVRMVQINLRAILQLAVMGIILYQHCPPGRFLLFATVGLALYVMGPAPLRRAWQRLLAMLPPMHEPGQHDAGLGGAGAAAAVPAAANGNAPAAAAGAAGAPPAAPAAAAVAGPHRPRGLVQELQALVVGFFTSLLPGFNINPEDAAAFAAAQQAANRAEALGAAREHND